MDAHPGQTPDTTPDASASTIAHKTDIALKTPATHVCAWGGMIYAWTGTHWRPAMRYETELSRAALRELGR